MRRSPTVAVVLCGISMAGGPGGPLPVSAEVRPQEALQREWGPLPDVLPDPGGLAPASPGFQPGGGSGVDFYRAYLRAHGWVAPRVWHQGGFLRSAQGNLGVNVFFPGEVPQGVFLFVHGYLSHSAAFAALLSAVVDHGWIVVTLDLPGHGLSEGPRSDISDFSDYGDAVATWLHWVEGQPRWPARRILAAHSLGTAACLEALRRPGIQAPGRIWFFAPLLRTAWFPVLAWAQDAFGWAIPGLPSPFGSDGYLDGTSAPTHWFRALRTWLTRLDAQGPLSLPLTIWSGDRDTVVDALGNRTMYQRLVPNAQYHLVPGVGHDFLTNPSERSPIIQALVQELDPKNEFPQEGVQ